VALTDWFRVVPNVPALISATALPTSIVASSGGNVSVITGKVTDAYGNPLMGQLVQFATAHPQSILSPDPAEGPTGIDGKTNVSFSSDGRYRDD
jgi:hypothetical protein